MLGAVVGCEDVDGSTRGSRDDLGSRRIVLETGILQPDAIRFYEREGYESIPLFGSYAGSAESVCFARDV